MTSFDDKTLITHLGAGYEITSEDAGQLFMRPHPIPGESWVGYLLRISAANHFKSLSVIASVCQYASINQLICDDPRKVLRWLGIQVTDTSGWVPYTLPRTRTFRKARLNKSIQQWKSRVCPLCLNKDKEQPYVRSHWDWSMQIYCPTHNVRLLEQCRSCNTPIDLRRNQVKHCDCGADFSQQESPGSEGEAETIARLLPEIDLSRSGMTFEREPEIHEVAVRLCQWLALSPDADGKRPKRKSMKNVRLSSNELDRMQEIVIDWPISLAASIAPEVDLDSLASRTALGKKLFRNQFDLYGIVTREIQKKFQSKNSATESHLQSRPQYFLGHRSNIDALEKLIGYSSRLIRHQIAMGAIVPGLLKYGDLFDPARIEIDAHAIELVTNFYSETLGLDSAAVTAGCSVSAIRGLVQLNVIPSQSICIDPVQLSLRRIYPADLQEIANDLFSRAKYKEDLTTNAVMFSDWNTVLWSSGGHSRSRWMDIFVAIRTGKLALHKSKKSPEVLDDLFLDPKELALVCDKRRSNRQCS